MCLPSVVMRGVGVRWESCPCPVRVSPLSPQSPPLPAQAHPELWHIQSLCVHLVNIISDTSDLLTHYQRAVLVSGTSLITSIWYLLTCYEQETLVLYDNSSSCSKVVHKLNILFLLAYFPQTQDLWSSACWQWSAIVCIAHSPSHWGCLHQRLMFKTLESGSKRKMLSLLFLSHKLIARANSWVWQFIKAGAKL